MTTEQIRAVDPRGMYDLIRNFPTQVREAVAIGTSATISLRAKGIEQIVLCGLGGSAIAGDLLRSYLADELKVPFLVNRAYALPRFVGPKTLVIISSYSGNCPSRSHQEESEDSLHHVGGNDSETREGAPIFSHHRPGRTPAARRARIFFLPPPSCIDKNGIHQEQVPGHQRDHRPS